MRYIVHDRPGGLLALLGFSTAARKPAPRDRFIGWIPALREKNLPKVIDNAQFLILPWIEIPNLVSRIPSVVCRQLIRDWTARYNTTPVLIETSVSTATIKMRGRIALSCLSRYTPKEPSLMRMPSLSVRSAYRR